MGHPRPESTALTFSPGIARIPGLAGVLGVEQVVHCRYAGRPRPERARMVVGWGRKPNTGRARRYAVRHGIPYVALEDGFLRSVGLGTDGAPPLALVVDDLGIYYDARSPSRLERLLLGELDDPALLARARTCIDRILAERLSKYNDAPEFVLPPSDRERVLVVDQTAGDLSIDGALANAGSFQRMLAAARDEHPAAELLIKIHPEVSRGRKRGHLERVAVEGPVRILDRPVNPVHLLEQVERVYTVSSQLGFEALLAGRPVTCFGVPFYAGWGLTDDRVAPPRERCPRSLEQLFAAACLLYSRYLDPETGEPCRIERVIDHLALQRRLFRENSGQILCYRIAPWKRGYVRRYLQSPWNRVRFVDRTTRLERLSAAGGDCRVLIWGDRCPPALRQVLEQRRLPLWRMEDGFLRSVGLGKGYTPPASLVIDRHGIYYDPASASDLERILSQTEFGPAELERARRLIDAIVRLDISKYNVGRRRPLQTGAPSGTPVVLVPGQVPGDASLRHGSPGIGSNAELVARVRQERPEAFLVYKPHPDVVGGHVRDPEPPPEGAVDLVVTEVDIASCLRAVDELHTLTSLAGFEALLREVPVTTWGRPFYAGWGLTEDRDPPPRRRRRLTLPELVAGVLIRYPRYLDYGTGLFTTPERVLQQLQGSLERQRHQPVRTGTVAREWRKLSLFFQGLGYRLRR